MKNKQSLHYQSATNLVAALSAGEISAAELLEQTIARIEHLDPKINAVVVRDFARARQAAKQADAAIAQGVRKPLLGLPITVKESFNVAGLPTTWGSDVFKNWQPDADALTVARLKAAGAIIIGKTNVPAMLMDWQTYNDLFGTTNNPWNLNYTPGGSSGGSAAALAAGFVALELGSDFAGSIRVPAHYCGVYGHKPSPNLVPMRGGGPPTTSPSPHHINDFIVAGPMARTAADLALALDVLAGPDEWWDGKGYSLSLPRARHTKLNDFRVLVLRTHPLCTTASVITSALDNLVERLVKLGVTISHDTSALPDLAEVTQTYVALFASFVAGRMPIEVYEHFRAAANTLQDTDNSLDACFLRGSIMTYRGWLTTTRTRDLLRQQWRNIFKEYDIILCPVMPTAAIPHDHSDPAQRQITIDGKLFSTSEQYGWVSLATLFGLPVTTVPIAHTEDDLPIGIQVIGDYLEDNTTIKFADLLEREFGGFTKHPKGVI